MKYANNYNPYKFILFIPLAIIAGLVYFLISTWSTLDTTTFVLLILILFAAITFLGYHISKENNPLKGMGHQRGDVEDIIQKIIAQKKGPISEDDQKMLRIQAENIYNSTYRRGERVMRLKLLMDEYLKKS